MTTPVITSEQLHLDTLREYQWLSTDADASFESLLRILRTLANADAVGLSVRALDAVMNKAKLGEPDLCTERYRDYCTYVIENNLSLFKKDYIGAPLVTPDGLVIGSLFAIRKQGSFQKKLLQDLEALAGEVIARLENRRLEARCLEAKSELSLKQKALTETKRLHRDFLSHLSHEMRTPLHAVLGLTELLQDEAHRIHHPKLLSNLTKSSQNMLETLNVLLEHAKLESGALRLQPSSFPFKEFLDETLTPFESIIQSRGLQFIKSYAIAETAICQVDRVRLRQVLNNLITNALKFTDKGSIKVEIEELSAPNESGENLFVFRVIDTGLGIHRFNHNLLFEPYRQVSGDSSKGGSGLGLSICKKIVECMQGQIGLESEYGQGSTFWFKIPLMITHSAHAAIPVVEEIIEVREEREGSILVIEDNSITRAVTVGSLEKLGYTVFSAENADSVTKKLDERDYHLVLMDLHLGDHKPAELLHDVRAKTAAPIVLVSGSKLPPEEMALGAIDDALQKPYARETMVETVDYWILSKLQTQGLIAGWSESLKSLADSCGEDFALQTISGFVLRHPSEIQKLQRYLDEENWAKLELAAHSMKSTLATLGLMELSRLVTEIEEVTPTHDRAHLESLIEHFRIDSRRTYPQLLGYVKKVFTNNLMPREKAS